MNGFLISLEGGEGCGKTVQLELLKKYLESSNLEVLATREPGGVKLAEDIRFLLLNPDVKDMDVMTEVLLYAAARRQLFISKIRPALEAGNIVICDRYVDSSIVYQGLVRGIPWTDVLSINQLAVNGTLPDLTLYLDIEPTLAQQRIHSNRNREVNRFDLAPVEFHEKVRSAYLNHAETFSNRIITIDASPSIEVIHNEIIKIVSHSLNLKHVIRNIEKETF